MKSIPYLREKIDPLNQENAYLKRNLDKKIRDEKSRIETLNHSLDEKIK